MKRALITGITGQDGSYLAELLLDKGYEVHGIIRRSSSFSTERIDHLFNKLHLHHGDLTDAGNLLRLVTTIQPTEVYNLGAMSHVRVSYEMSTYTAMTVGIGAQNVLDAILHGTDKTQCRFYQASSSEMFGSTPPPQNENSPFHPRSIYGCSKVFAYHTTIHYREAYDMHASNGILFNHESERRGETFVTRKISRAVARIKLGLQKELRLGNLDALRDWGYAPDYVEAMWLMLQQDKPGDYVVATGEMHSVREFLTEAFSYVGLDWNKYVVFDERYLRPTEVDALQGDPTKVKEKLGWRPKVGFTELVRRMVDYDLKRAESENALRST